MFAQKKSLFFATALAVGLISPLAIGFTFAQDYYAPRSNFGPKGVQVYDPRNDANARLGTGCRLVIEGDEVYSGICNVSRRDRVTVIDTGSERYRIIRDEDDPRTGILYRGLNRSIATVYAVGRCWRNDEAMTRYCAN